MMFPAGNICQPDNNQEDSTRNDLNWLKPSSYRPEEVRAVEEPSRKEKSRKRKPLKEKPTTKPKDSKYQLQVKEFISSKIFLEDIPHLKPENAFFLEKRGNRKYLSLKGTPKEHRPMFAQKQHFVLGAEEYNPIPKKILPRKAKTMRYYHKRVVKKFLAPSLPTSSTATSTDLYTMNLSNSGDNDRKHLLDTLTRLSTTVYQSPHDIAAWLSLFQIQCQGGALLSWDANRQAQHPDTAASSVKIIEKIIREKQEEILEKSIQANPSNIHLRAAFLEMVCEHWEVNRVEREWAQLNLIYLNDVQVWKWHLFDFFIHQFLLFNCTQIVDKMSQCFTTLTKVITRKLASHRPKSQSLSQIVDLFFLYCDWLRCSGHSERTISSWQVALEFACNFPLSTPSNLNLSRFSSFGNIRTDAKVQCFDKFWNASGLAVFGVPGAQGWRHWWQRHTELVESISTNSSSSDNGASSLKNVPASFEWWAKVSLLQDEINRFEDTLKSQHVPVENETEDGSDELPLQAVGVAWQQLETLRDKNNWYPALSLDDDRVDEDPQRVVLFDDLTCCLLPLCDEWLDAHINLQCRRQLALLYLRSIAGRELDLALGDWLWMVHAAPDIIYQCELESIQWLQEIQFVDTPHDIWEERTRLEFVQASLDQLIACPALLGESDNDRIDWHSSLSILSLRFSALKSKADKDKKNLITSGKQILSHSFNQKSLLVWCEYALLLWRENSFKASRKVFDNAMKVSSSVSVDSSIAFSERMHLVMTYVLLELGCHPRQCFITPLLAQSRLSISEKKKKVFQLLYSALLVDDKDVGGTALTVIQLLKLTRAAQRLQEKWLDDTRQLLSKNVVVDSALFHCFRVLNYISISVACLHFFFKNDLPAFSRTVDVVLHWTLPSGVSTQHSLLWCRELIVFTQILFQLLYGYSAAFMDAPVEGDPVLSASTAETLPSRGEIHKLVQSFWEKVCTAVVQYDALLDRQHSGLLRSPYLCVSWLQASHLIPGPHTTHLLHQYSVWNWFQWRETLKTLSVTLHSRWPLVLLCVLHLHRQQLLDAIVNRESHIVYDDYQLATLFDACLEKELHQQHIKGANATAPQPGDSFEHCTIRLLWRLYLSLHCVHSADSVKYSHYSHFSFVHSSAKKAIGLFYRAIQAFPYDKFFYRLIVEHFPDKVHEVVDIMNEKGLRVRVPIEEIELLLREN